MTITLKTRLSALAAALLAAVMLAPLTPASATNQVDAGAVALTGSAHLHAGLNASGEGCFGGLAVGAGALPATTAVASSAFANFTYTNTAVLGDAQGEVMINSSSGPLHANFSWIRAGANALVFLGDVGPDPQGGNHDGVAVAAFAPADAGDLNFDCGGSGKDGSGWSHNSPAPNDAHAQVVAVGVLAAS